MDLILFNGCIKTMNPLQPQAQAIAIDRGRIRQVGGDAEILASKTPRTQLIDLGQRLVTPGFIDAHMHLTTFGNNLQECDLYHSASVREVIERCRRFITAKNIPAGQWVIGKGWHQDYFDVKEMPTRRQLDEISTEHPICLICAGFHSLSVNTKALEVAGVNESTKQPEGGRFGVGEDGLPNGIFLENAMKLINDKLPRFSYENIKTFIRDACAYANSRGITSIQTDDFMLAGTDYYDVIRAYLELIANNEIHVRIYEQCNIPDEKALEEFISHGYVTGWGDDRFKIGPYKLIADGNIGGRTACLCEPYSDQANNCGMPIYSQSALDNLTWLAHKNGMQLAVHCIGDRASYMTLEAFEKVLRKKPREDHRHSLIHCQILDSHLIEMMRSMGVIANVQPIFLNYDLHVVEDRIGRERTRTSYNWRTLLDEGIHVAFSSDCPVEPMDVTLGIYSAVTRRDLQGVPAEGWYPEQRLSVDEAVYAFTMGAAYASFEEDRKGSLEPGKYADLVVLDRDLYSIAPEDIKEAKVLLTVMDGEIVYQVDDCGF